MGADYDEAKQIANSSAAARGVVLRVAFTLLAAAAALIFTGLWWAVGPGWALVALGVCVFIAAVALGSLLAK